MKTKNLKHPSVLASGDLKRRGLLGAALATATQAAFADDLFGTLKNQIEAIQKSLPQVQAGPAATVSGAASGRFEDGITLATYQRTFEANFRIPGGRAIESPIRGLGLIKVSADYEPVFLNSDATFFGARQWYGLDRGKPRELAADEQIRIRSELLGRLRWDSLVGPVWGRGAPRKALVYSAPDCPFCLAMERDLVASEAKLGYELYYLPTMLNKGSRVAGQIWCSPNKPAAWLQAMARKPLQAPSGCDQDYYSLAVADALLLGKKLASGAVSTGTPTIVLESGERGNWESLKRTMLSA